MDKPKIEIKQTFYEENRERFQADSHGVDVTKLQNCQHAFYRFDKDNICCRKCSAGWFDRGEIQLP